MSVVHHYFLFLGISKISSWYLHNPPNSSNPTWNYHLDNYGPVSNPALGLGSQFDRPTLSAQDVVYDDFIANFTAGNWNASAWLDLFDEAGAKYFVLVTVCRALVSRAFILMHSIETS